MWSFLQRVCSRIITPVSWTVFTIILLCIPGSDIPGNGLFSIEHLDKVAHVILFGGIVLSWGFYFSKKTDPALFRQRIIWAIVFSTVLGIGLEFLQRYAIPNRSFDVGDIWADFGGATVAGFLHLFRKGINTKRV